MAITFTKDEKQLLKFKVFDQNVDPKEINDSDLPTDIHLVEYSIGDTLYFDSVRAYKAVDIFDPYYDKLKALGGELISITSGYGNIKPKLFQGSAPSDD